MIETGSISSYVKCLIIIVFAECSTGVGLDRVGTGLWCRQELCHQDKNVQKLITRRRFFNVINSCLNHRFKGLIDCTD